MWQKTYIPRKTNHVLHLLITVFLTCGMWAPVWVGVAIFNTVAPDEEHLTWTPYWDGQKWI